jgi:hypothetical protein
MIPLQESPLPIPREAWLTMPEHRQWRQLPGGFNGSWGMQVSPSPTNNFLGNLTLQGSSTISNIPFVTYDVYVYMSSNANQ